MTPPPPHVFLGLNIVLEYASCMQIFAFLGIHLAKKFLLKFDEHYLD